MNVWVLLLQTKAELDQDLRAEMYHEMCQIARDDGGTIIPLFVNFVYARRKNVRHGPERCVQLGMRRRPGGTSLVVRLILPNAVLI